MRISYVCIENFRNFKRCEVVLGQNIVLVGENKAGKSNFITALRLVLDPLQNRQLVADDFWDGDGQPFDGRSIKVTVKITDFGGDTPDLVPLTWLSSCLIEQDPPVAQLTYLYFPDVKEETVSVDENEIRLPQRQFAVDDYKWKIYPKDDSDQKLSLSGMWQDMPLDFINALRDMASDSGVWARSPLKELIKLSDDISSEKIQPYVDDIADASKRMVENLFNNLRGEINTRLISMVGKLYNVDPQLGLDITNSDAILKALRVLVDGDRNRSLTRTSLGLQNAIYLSLLSLQLAGCRKSILCQLNDRQITISNSQNRPFATHISLQIMNLTGFSIPFSGIRQGATAPPLAKLQRMQPFQVVSQANQGPFATSGEHTAQGKLTEAQHFLDDANDRFDRRFAQAVEGVANFGTQLVSHLFFKRCIISWWVGIVQEKSTPTLMMGTAPSGDIRVNATFFQASDVIGAEITRVQIGFFRLSQCWWHGVDSGQSGLLVVGVIAQPVANDETTVMRHNNLDIVMLVKTAVVGVLHDARFGVGEIVLVFIARPRRRWFGWSPRRFASLFSRFFFSHLHFGLIFRFFSFVTSLGAGFQYLFGLSQPFQLLLTPFNLVLDVHLIGQLTSIGGFGQGKQLIDLGVQIRFNGQQSLVTDCFALGSVSMDFAAIQTDVAQLQTSHLLGYQQNLDKQLFQFGQKLLAKGSNGVMVWVHIASYETERYHFVGRLFDLARTENASGIAVKQQPQQYFRCVWWRALVTILVVNSTQIKLGNQIDNETSQMVRRQDITQADLQIKRLFVISGSEFSCHVQSLHQNYLCLENLTSPTNC